VPESPRAEKIVIAFAPRPGRPAVAHCEDVQIQTTRTNACQRNKTPAQRTDCAMSYPKSHGIAREWSDAHAQCSASVNIRDHYRAQYHHEAETICIHRA
jgi:hypothetical protein